MVARQQYHTVGDCKAARTVANLDRHIVTRHIAVLELLQAIVAAGIVPVTKLDHVLEGQGEIILVDMSPRAFLAMKYLATLHNDVDVAILAAVDSMQIHIRRKGDLLPVCTTVVPHIVFAAHRIKVGL